MKAIHYIYFHYKPDYTVFYIGQSNDLKRPYSKLGRSIFWHNVVKKYGFEVMIAHAGLTKDEANILEKHYIKEFGRRDLGLGELVNRTDGADGGSNKIFNSETRLKMSLSHKGEKNIMFGKKHTQETKNKISNVHKGKKLSTERADALRKINKGRIKSKSEIEKLRQSKIGKPRPDWVKQKVSLTKLKKSKSKVIAVKDCAVYEFDSMKEAEITLQRQRKSIRTAALKNTRCNGFNIYL